MANAEYVISSQIEESQVPELEQLFYFNPNQWRLQKALENSVAHYGTPQIVRQDGRLRMVLAKVEGAQTLYLYRNARKRSLIGVLFYIREEKSLKVLFWGVSPDYTLHAMNGQSLLFKLVDALKEIGRQIVGVEFVKFTYGTRDHTLRI